MEKEYYILWYRLNKKDGYLIWYSDDTDGVLTNESGKIISFSSKDKLLEYASNNKFEINPEDPELHNMDIVTAWIEANDPTLINFGLFNNIWNLWTDIANSTGLSFDQDRDATDKIYDKLFWESDLPTANPEDRKNSPEWTEDELKTLRDMFSNGMAMFQDSLIFAL